MRALIICLIFVCTLASAAIYKQLDQSGQVVFSDTPINPNATVIQPSPLEGYTTTETIKTITTTVPKNAVKTPAKAIDQQDADKTILKEIEQIPYKTFLIVSPKDQETIQNQPVSIPVDIVVEPKLAQDNKIQLYLDGKPAGPPAATTHFELPNVERNIHQVHAEIIDGNQRSIKQSNNITIYVHRASVNFPNRPQPQ